MKILLINPVTPDTYWSFTHSLPFIKKKSLIPPLGLLTVAAQLPSHWEARLIDMDTDSLKEKDILEADLVFLTGMIVQKESFQDVLKTCNRLGVPVAAGGPYLTSTSDDVSGVDFRFYGEIEETLPRFVAEYEAGSPQREYRVGEKPDMTQIPPPRFDLVDMNKYSVLGLQFSRGCPFDCEFCDIVALFGNRTRTKTPDQFIKELDVAYATGFNRSVFIVDDNFIGNKRKVKELLRAIIPWQKERNYPFTFLTEASVNLAMDEELMDLMVESGFHQVFLGIETPIPESLKKVNKGQNIAGDLKESIRKIQDRGLEVTAGFIIGFDSDPPEIFDLQIQFIQELAIPAAMVGLLMALPNTKLYYRFKSEGRLRGESLGNNTHAVSLNFDPIIPEKDLIEGYYRVLASVYNPKAYFDRCLKLLNRFQKIGRKKKMGDKGFAPWEVIVLFRSLFRQSFSSYGLHYLKFIWVVLTKYPKLIEEGITLAVQGHHFFTITKKTITAQKEKSAFLRKIFRGTIKMKSYPLGGYKTAQ